MNSLLLSPLVFSFILKLVVVVVVVVILQGKPLGNTVALNSDLGFSAFSKKNFGLHKI